MRSGDLDDSISGKFVGKELGDVPHSWGQLHQVSGGQVSLHGL